MISLLRFATKLRVFFLDLVPLSQLHCFVWGLYSTQLACINTHIYNDDTGAFVSTCWVYFCLNLPTTRTLQESFLYRTKSQNTEQYSQMPEPDNPICVFKTLLLINLQSAQFSILLITIYHI